MVDEHPAMHRSELSAPHHSAKVVGRETRLVQLATADDPCLLSEEFRHPGPVGLYAAVLSHQVTQNRGTNSLTPPAGAGR